METKWEQHGLKMVTKSNTIAIYDKAGMRIITYYKSNVTKKIEVFFRPIMLTEDLQELYLETLQHAKEVLR